MNKSERLFVVCIVLATLLVLNLRGASGGEIQRHYSSDIQEVIHSAETGDPKKKEDAQNLLWKLPVDRLVEELRDVCEDQTIAGATRGILLKHLADRGVTREQRAFDLFFSCLAEEVVVYNALSALPGERGDLVIGRIETLLRNTNDMAVNKKRVLLQILTSYERRAEGAQDIVRQIVLTEDPPPSDERPRGESIRTAAAETLLWIAGAEAALEAFEDVEDKEVLLVALAVYGGKTHGTFNADPEIRAEARKLVLDALRHGEKQARTDAFEALLFVYDRDFVYIKEDGSATVHPDVKGALEHMIENETDAGLLQRARGVYDTLDRRLERALQKRADREQLGDNPQE